MPRSPGLVSVKAPAKINLFLYVLDRQPDGYHRLISLMQTVGLYDRIGIRRVRARRKVVFRSTGLSLPKGQDNLVVRAARFFLDQYRIKGGVAIHLEKKIPVSAGLGGGSSDAAGTIRALYQLWGVQAAMAERFRLGRRVGSDVPFFLSGASALVEETGERIRPVKSIGPGWAVLVNPNQSVSTTWAFKTLDEIRFKRGSRRLDPDKKIRLTWMEKRNKIRAQLRLTFQLKKLSPYLHNDLEEATCEAYPVVAFVKERLRCVGARGVLMSGSGPTVYGLFHQSYPAHRAARVLRMEHPDWRVWAVRILERRTPLIRGSSNG